MVHLCFRRFTKQQLQSVSYLNECFTFAGIALLIMLLLHALTLDPFHMLLRHMNGLAFPMSGNGSS